MIGTQECPYWVTGHDGPYQAVRTERYLRIGRFVMYWFKPSPIALIIRLGWL